MHIGNYFGAVANWVKLQETHTCIYGVADLHAMTIPYAPEQLRAYTARMVIDLLACGIDPDKALLFVQSLVPEHAELCWILQCVCSYQVLAGMAQFKDRSGHLKASRQFISTGLFTYPILQATDILMYRAEYIPVGKDQEQHLDLTQGIARRFNYLYGPCFPELQPLFSATPKILSLADPERKMSKSLGPVHYIGLFEDEASIRAKVRGAVTDTGILPKGVVMSPGVANLFTILEACGRMAESAELRQAYARGSLHYTTLKDAVAEALVAFTGGLRERRCELLAHEAQLRRRVLEMTDQARARAHETLKTVRARVGLMEREP
jgi:tryptophanyl-tRNA synthetase